MNDATPGQETQSPDAGGVDTKAGPETLPVLPLRGTCLLPLAVMPLTIGRERSQRLVDHAMRNGRRIAVVMQRDPSKELAGPEDLYDVGTIATIHQMQRVRDEIVHLVVQGGERIRLVEFTATEPFLTARVERMPEPMDTSLESEAALRSLRENFRRLVALVPELPDILADGLDALEDPNQSTYVVAGAAPVDAAARQEILALDSVSARLKRLIEILQHEIAVRELGKKITSEAEATLTKAQRDVHLREQLRAIQRELGEDDADVATGLQERIEQAGLPPEARAEADRELGRLRRMSSASPEHSMIRTFLEWMADLPWSRTTGKAIDVERAARVLDEDHYDLEKVKDRILEYLSVRRLKSERDPGDAVSHEPILCFVGPPGVGKTSLGQSIGRALGREFVRISLGGVHEEPEIRGHRRTYIGSMPGRIVQALRRAGSADPVFMLDEVDKLGRGVHGDPSSALLEVLDPAQNSTYVDHYLGVPFDLSRVLFICTANTTSTIPGPLIDRMEMIELPGYTEAEKSEIARRYLIGREISEHGLRVGELEIDDAALLAIIRDYTHEAGVRGLGRTVATVCRKAARLVLEGREKSVRVTPERLVELLGPPRRPPSVAERTDRPGVATGLAWTPMGGDILFVEAAILPGGKGALTLTGSLGDVMRESAQTAVSLVRARAVSLGLDPHALEGRDIHIHVPSGAIPKDGPSAGVTMVTALVSALANRPVESDVAMTGEITLRGKVTPVGGVREKLLAAHRAGLRRVLIPRWNMMDVDELPPPLRAELEITPVDAIEDVLAVALPHSPSPTRLDPADE